MVSKRESQKLSAKFDEGNNKPINELAEINRFSDTSRANQIIVEWKFK